ncbi:MAG: class I SAM-dependent methyltransferase [Candidatus Omnitrophica bacterium]|nr:class I SAM-dependent methyltransferase [Candidatus Omnitrophota bacterium]MDD5352455.1 class I SAM-dependent methyltransferase [Candidatus Omnitrophota bacterium]MDD5550053.1 class I SAM-dependent methyltransferase [Candidatus Omnitrophota bacterium]
MIVGRVINFIGQGFIRLFWKLNCRLSPMYQERTCEYPFVLTRLKLKKGKVADFGCANSLMISYLASLGFDVFGVDFKEGDDSKFIHNYPNYSFVRSDICSLPFENEKFDASISISTLEHILSGDKKALEEIVRVTKKDGQIFISMPYGSGEINNLYIEAPHKIYNEKLLKNLLDIPGIKIEEAAYFKKRWPVWTKVERQDVEDVDSRQEVKGVVCLSLIRI